MAKENDYADMVLSIEVDELPDTYHGCHYFNNGVFPYIIRDGLELMLAS